MKFQVRATKNFEIYIRKFWLILETRDYPTRILMNFVFQSLKKETSDKFRRHYKLNEFHVFENLVRYRIYIRNVVNWLHRTRVSFDS